MTEEHLNVAIEPRVTDAEIRSFGNPTDPTALFEIIEARTQEIQAVLEDAGILSDRIRRRGAPPWDYEDFIGEDPEFLTRYYESRRADLLGRRRVDLAEPVPVHGALRRSAERTDLRPRRDRAEERGRRDELAIRGIGRKQALFAVQPLANRAIAVGEKGLMRVSDDGGVSWHEQRGFPTIFTFMRDIHFDPDERVGYIVGQRGTVLRSTDSGQSWQQVLPKEEPVEVAESGH